MFPFEFVQKHLLMKFIVLKILSGRLVFQIKNIVIVFLVTVSLQGEVSSCMGLD